jgi:hypothetical protein
MCFLARQGMPLPRLLESYLLIWRSNNFKSIYNKYFNSMSFA